MGRHSSGNEWPFYRSVVAWLLPWVIMAGIAIAAVWVAVDTLSKDDVPVVSVGPTPTDTPTIQPTTPEPIDTPTPTQKPKPDKSPKDEPPELITAGISVQVLNGTRAPEADDLMADRLARLGYKVVAIGEASRAYARTTVFWSYPAAERAARALAERFDWIADLKPDNLSSTVDIHVVVGADEA